VTAVAASFEVSTRTVRKGSGRTSVASPNSCRLRIPRATEGGSFGRGSSLSSTAQRCS
jgi:hypothetical protein